MSNFKIGQKVVCMDDLLNPRVQNNIYGKLQKHRTYKILGIDKSHDCPDGVGIDIGHTVYFESGVGKGCCVCGFTNVVINSGDPVYYSHRRFRPLTYSESFISSSVSKGLARVGNEDFETEIEKPLTKEKA